MNYYSCLFLLSFLYFTNSSAASKNLLVENVHVLYPGAVQNCSAVDAPQLQIYCYHGRPKHLLHIWQTVILKIIISSENYEVYEGAVPESVQSSFKQHKSFWNINLLWGSRKLREIKLPPFNNSCIGIVSDKPYSVQLHVIRLDYWRLILLLSGIFMFLSAPRLSENPLFYYICGVSFGIMASFLILIYLLSRIFPRRPMMYGFVIGGWTVGVYLLQLLWDNLRIILQEYKMYIILYVATSGFLSFMVCYRFGPVTDKRSKNLIKWCLQGLPLVVILLSSHFQEATLAIVLLLLAFYNFPKSLVSKAKSQWKRRFPPKVRLLNEDEYYEQGVRETKKALDELRGYCSSPDCNQWKTVLRLQDPVRFAKFMEGTSHLNDNEVLEYETTSAREIDYTDESDLTDDDD